MVKRQGRRGHRTGGYDHFKIGARQIAVAHVSHLALEPDQQQYRGNKAGERRCQRQTLVLHLLHQQKVEYNVENDRQQRVDGGRFGILQGVVHIDGNFLQAVKQQPQCIEEHHLAGALYIVLGEFTAQEKKLNEFPREHHHSRRNRDNKQPDDSAAGAIGALQLFHFAGSGKTGKLREQRCGDGDHKHRGNKAGDAIAVVQHRNYTLRKQRGNAFINDDVDGVDGLAEENGQHHHQELADISVAERSIGVVAELMPQRHQQYQQKLAGIADDNTPTQNIVVFAGGKNGSDDRDVQRHAHHTDSKKTPLHLQIALQNIPHAEEYQRGDHHRGKVYRQVKLRPLKAQCEQPYNGVAQCQKHCDKAHRKQKRHGDDLIMKRFFLPRAVLLEVGIDADVAGKHGGAQSGKQNSGQRKRHHIGVADVAGAVRERQRKLPAEAENLSQYSGQHHDDGMYSGFVH